MFEFKSPNRKWFFDFSVRGGMEPWDIEEFGLLAPSEKLKVIFNNYHIFLAFEKRRH